MAFEAAAKTRHAIRTINSGDFEGALASARRGLALALTVSHDDTVVAEMYFSWGFKYAIYLPLVLPIAVPILVTIIRHFKRYRKLKALNKQEASPEEVM